MSCQPDGSMVVIEKCQSGCLNAECVRSNCGDIEDGKTVCMDNYLVSICHEGELFGYNECDRDTQICINGECVNVNKNCGDIEDSKFGCSDGNIVLCQDGKLLDVEDGNCIEKSKYCIYDELSENGYGYSCKSPDSTDCEWKNGLIAQNESICDGNILLTCTDGFFDKGIDCTATSDLPSFCDPILNSCRVYKNCGNYGEIPHNAIVCNQEGTNKAQCNDGKLINLTGDKACPSVPNATPVCTYQNEASCSFACKNGYTKVNDGCQKIANCNSIKEIYDEAANTCSCDTSRHWTGTPGNCACEEGYVLVGSVCEPQMDCETPKEIFNTATNSCQCNTENHWTGTPGNCTCMDGYIFVDNVCEVKKTCDPIVTTHPG